MKSTILKLALILVVLFSFNNTFAQQVCLKNAWNDYNSKNFKSAINYCDQCIEDFGSKALKMQKDLETQGLKNSDFPTGQVTAAVKAKIFGNWAINDVATACWIKGRSAEAIYKTDKSKNSSFKQVATEAYNQACLYSFGRCWDPQGWFWSPCEESKGRLPIN